jgi:ankyrin repeat protein
MSKVECADVSAGDWKDMFLAACDGDVELVRYHLDRGVDVDFVHAEFQSTVLVATILAGEEDVAHLLLDRGADPTARSPLEGQTPLDAASEVGMTAVVERLRARGCGGPGAGLRSRLTLPPVVRRA